MFLHVSISNTVFVSTLFFIVVLLQAYPGGGLACKAYIDGGCKCNLQTVLTKLEVAILLTSADLDHLGFNNNLATYSSPRCLLTLYFSLTFLTHRLTIHTYPLMTFGPMYYHGCKTHFVPLQPVLPVALVHIKLKK